MRLHKSTSVMAVHSYHVLPDKACDFLIELYDSNPSQHERIENDFKPTFTQLNLNRYHGKIVPELCSYFNKSLDLYKSRVKQAQYLPKVELLEEFRIKKYNVGGSDRFDEHVDVVDHKTSKRCLAMLFYLNSVPVGGHTRFPEQGDSIRPTKGYVVVFPPTWEYPHIGEPPISNPKYIMSTYLHYH